MKRIRARLHQLRERLKAWLRAKIWAMLHITEPPYQAYWRDVAMQNEERARVLTSQLRTAHCKLAQRLETIEHLAEECERLRIRLETQQ